MSGVATRSPSYHRVVRWVARWADLYTAGVEERLAAHRRDEIASDLWEQGSAADSAGRGGRRTAISMLWRGVRGVPADLSWRHSRRRPDPGRVSLADRWQRSGLLAVAIVVDLIGATGGAATLARMVVATVRGEYVAPPAVILAVATATVGMVVGLALLTRPRRRWVGAVIGGAGAITLLATATPALLYTSTTFEYLVYNGLTTGFGGDQLNRLLIGTSIGLGIFHAALALLWLPARSGASGSEVDG